MTTTADRVDHPSRIVRVTQRKSSFSDFVRRLARSRGALVGLAIIGLVILMAITAPVLAPYDPTEVDTANRLMGPSTEHFLGTDHFGRDLFSRTVFGSRISLIIGIIAVSIGASIGILAGLTAGFYGRIVDSIIMRSVDVMLAFPGILLALAIITVLRPSLVNLMIAVGLSSVPVYARLARGSTLMIREEAYIEASRVNGANDALILRRHILPNILAPLIVAATLGVGSAILWAAALSFLGLGSQPPTPEWGRMLSDGRSYMRDAWWISTFPGLAIMLTVLGMNLLGDGLRDALDPKLHNR